MTEENGHDKPRWVFNNDSRAPFTATHVTLSFCGRAIAVRLIHRKVDKASWDITLTLDDVNDNGGTVPLAGCQDFRLWGWKDGGPLIDIGPPGLYGEGFGDAPDDSGETSLEGTAHLVVRDEE